jgi:hypothetical protein
MTIIPGDGYQPGISIGSDPCGFQNIHKLIPSKQDVIPVNHKVQGF